MRSRKPQRMSDPMLNLSVQRDANISIHQQLVTQLSLQIASGQLPEGIKLPSVRSLSARLGIHYNTCLGIYKELASLGLVEIKKGSGVIVGKFAASTAENQADSWELQQMARYFAQMVHQKGYQWNDVVMALNRAYEQLQQQSRRVTFVDVHPDILPVFKAELEHFLHIPIQVVTMDEVASAPPDDTTTWLVSRYHYRQLKEFLNDEETVLIIDVGSGQQEIERIKSLPEGAMVVVISHSQTILEMAEAVISGLRGHELLVRLVQFNEGLDEIQNAVHHARLVCSDFLCAQQLSDQIKTPVSVMRVIPDEEMGKIRETLRLSEPNTVLI
jgi:DNA-binding transcriptional regulator YhcF (GntR family)